MRYAFDARGPYARCAWTFLAAALAACSTTESTSPITPAERADLSSATASVPPAASGPVKTLSNRFAYLLADQPTAQLYTPDPNYSYNATGGYISVYRNGTGGYQVVFNSPSGWGARNFGFAVTAHGSSTLGCAWRGYYIQTSQLVADVMCFDRVTKLAADSRFSLLMVGSGSLFPRSAFTTADQPSAPSYTPGPIDRYSSSTAGMTITRASAGDYDVNLGTGSPAQSTFLVNEAFVNAGAACTIGAWRTASVQVRCFEATGAPSDYYYRVLQVDGGRPGRRLGFAWANQPAAASYTPNVNYSFNSSGGAVTVTRSGVGHYMVDFAGLQKFTGKTENAQVTPWGTKSTSCNAVGWWNSGVGLRVGVECRKLDGSFTDARFNVVVIE